jgi:hypothetical protein
LTTSVIAACIASREIAFRSSTDPSFKTKNKRRLRAGFRFARSRRSFDAFASHHCSGAGGQSNLFTMRRLSTAG